MMKLSLFTQERTTFETKKLQFKKRKKKTYAAFEAKEMLNYKFSFTTSPSTQKHTTTWASGLIPQRTVVRETDDLYLSNYNIL